MSFEGLEVVIVIYRFIIIKFCKTLEYWSTILPSVHKFHKFQSRNSRTIEILRNMPQAFFYSLLF